MWQKGSKEVKGYENIGANYTLTLGDGTSIKYNQIEPVEITETFLSDRDFETQMTGNVNPNGTFEKKEGDEGNCHTQTAKMVQNTGAEMEAGEANNASNPVEYVIQQAKQGKSVGMHVDDNGRNGSNTGDHWIASSSITTQVETQITTNIGFSDPAGRNVTESRGRLTIKDGQMKGGQERKDFRGYKVINVRKNKK